MTDTLEIFGTEYTGVTGIKATDDNSQTKTYIRPQGTKSISTNGTGIDVTEYASVNVAVPAGITPTGNINITSSGSTDVTNYATATVPAVQLKGMLTPTVQSHTISVDANGEITAEVVIYDEETPVYQNGFATTSDTVAMYNQSGQAYQLDTQTAKTVTPTTSPQTAVAAGKYTTGAVTVAAMPTGTAGTPTATKGSVSNHAVSVTPSVTNTAGYIEGSTKTGTAVTVSASELVSGSQTITENGDVDVTNLASVTVNVSGGSVLSVGTKAATPSSASNSIQFTGLSGNPLSFVVTSSTGQTTGGTKVVSIAYDGTSLHGMDITTQAEADTGFTKSYSNGTLTITATTALFQANEYKLVYAYGGSSSDVHTANVQVGSGATSITFTGLSGRPSYFSCVFKSNFSTSSGYQRVIDVVNDGTSTYGHAMDSAANAQTSWSYTYSGGSLTISSASTNNGGYFHQPGYYQLTYVVDDSAPNYQTKTGIGASTSSQTITADSGYDALESVQIDAVTQTNLTAANIKNGTTISINNGSSNLWSVTGTYTGGGGSSKNAQTAQSTTRSTSTTYTEVISLTCTKAGTYNVYWSTFRSSTSGTWGSQLYLNDSAYGTAETGSWSNHIQNIHLSNVTIAANADVSVRVRSRGSNYYGYVGTLTIIEA